MIKEFAPTGEKLIFYNYKEPLKKVEGGYGYMGAILTTPDGAAIQCHICGKLYKSLSMHIFNNHEITVREYKEKYGLAYRTSLVSEQERTRMKEMTLEWLKNMSQTQKDAFKKRQSEGYKEYLKQKLDRKQPKLTLESKNRRGTCPDQLLAKLNEVAKSIGHSPSKREFIDYWQSQKYVHIIYATFGSWDKAKQMAGLSKSSSENMSGVKKIRHERDELLEYLNIFYKENGKVPTETDCRRGLIPDSGIYRKMFGSFPKAREEAGILEKVGRFINKK